MGGRRPSRRWRRSARKSAAAAKASGVIGSGDLAAAVGLQDALGGGGVFLQLARGADGALDEVATAIGAGAAQDVLGAAAAEGAFEGADQGVGRVGREVLVAAFAVGAQLEHGRVLRWSGSCGDHRK